MRLFRYSRQPVVAILYGGIDMYSRAEIRNALLNWGEIECVDYIGNALDTKCDIELALKKLYSEERKAAYTLLVFGESCIMNGVVKQHEVVDVVEDLFQILNVEGLADGSSNSN